MDTENSIQNVRLNDTTSSFSLSKNTLIIILLILLIFSFLGINILNLSGGFIDGLMKIFGPLITQILSIFGYTTGTIIDKSADVITDTSIAGIQIANGTFHSIGDLLKNASKGDVNPITKEQLDKAFNLNNLSAKITQAQEQTQAQNQSNLPKLDNSINISTLPPAMPSADNAESAIQKPITSGKTNWCLVGEYQGRRGCIEVDDQDKCLSGQVFPSQKMCLNPTVTNNMRDFLKSTSENDIYQPSPNLARPIY